MMDEEDGMDSLFEGMVLFTPSDQLADEHQPELHEASPPLQVLDSQSDDANHNSNNIAEIVVVAEEAPHHHQPLQKPLDENLFSDLNIVSSPIQTLTTTLSDPIPTASFSSSVTSPNPLPTTDTSNTPDLATGPISYPSFRKKKRAASIRIGYGRDQPSPPSPPATPNLSNLSDDRDHHEVTVDENDTSSDIHDGASQTSATVPSHDDANVHTMLSNSHLLNKKDESLSQFDSLKAQISHKLEGGRLLMASVSAARKECVRSRRKATEDFNLASAKHAHLEQQLEVACEAEDFETAEGISKSLVTEEKERQTLIVALKDAEARCEAIDSEMYQALDSQIAAEEECASLLYNFAKDAENKACLVLKNAQLLSSKEMDDWLSTSEFLEAKMIELDIESHFISEARLLLNDSTQHVVRDDRNEKETLSKKKDVLTNELHNLLTLVKLKEMEIAENDAKIKEVDERIAAAVSDFEEIQSSINSKFDDLQSNLSQMHMQREALSSKRKEIDKFLAEEEDHGAKVRELARLSEDEAKGCQEAVELRKSLKSSVLKLREDKLALAKTEEKLSEEVQVLQQEVSAARGSLQELSSAKSSIQQNISSFKQRILFIDERFPGLEAEKKVFAAARNFKEAARIAAEAKSLSVEKDSLQTELGKATSDLEKLEEDIKETVSRLQTTEGHILSKEKEVAMTRCQRLLLIAGAATAERFAALELGDTEEADLLLAEAEAAKDEAKKLQPICKFKEEEFSIPKHSISLELVSYLGRKQLAELAAAVHLSTSQ